MAEVLGLVASIIEVSSFGLKLSKNLHDYGAAVIGAERRLAGLDRDIGFTSGILSELGTLLNDGRVQALVSEQSIALARDAVAECDGIFQAMEGVIANIRQNGLGKFKMYFRETKIELLRSNLDRMKGNLTLLMGVINHATQISIERPDETTIAAHRRKIRELMLEKEAYTQKYLAEKQKYDTLLAKVNSTSTLGSISTTRTGPVAAESRAMFAWAEGADTAGSLVAPELSRPANVNGEPHFLIMQPFGQGEPSRQEYADSGLSPHERRGEIAWPQQSHFQPGIVPPPAPPLPTRRVDQFEKRSTKRREKAAEVVKTAARRSGYVVAGVAAVVFFPVTIPVFLVWRRRRSERQSMGLNVYHDAVGSLPHPVPQPYMNHQHQMPFNPYESVNYAAELPAPHELDSRGPELDLTSRLTNIGPELLGGIRTSEVSGYVLTRAERETSEREALSGSGPFD